MRTHTRRPPQDVHTTPHVVVVRLIVYVVRPKVVPAVIHGLRSRALIYENLRGTPGRVRDVAAILVIAPVDKTVVRQPGSSMHQDPIGLTAGNKTEPAGVD